MSRRAAVRSSAAQIDTLPPATDWRTTDADEIARRRLRAREEKPVVLNLDPAHPIFSNFEVRSPSGQNYRVELRDLASRHQACTCTDFRINGLGTCKHVEAVLLHLEQARPAELATARAAASPRTDLVPDPAAGALRIERNLDRLPPRLRALFRDDGLLRHDVQPHEALARITAAGTDTGVRVSQEVAPWFEARRRERERRERRRDYETGVASGRHPAQETLLPLFPYQREGMLHLAFTERALLADEMGLGKTAQAVAACALLHRLGHARRVLIVTPASLKGEWEEQIRRFTTLPLRLVFGARAARLALYSEPKPPLFTIANYEQVVTDFAEINEHLRPDIVVLDEAQRIKNWATKTALAVKRLRSRYAFVLTGTPIENRIDELRSIIDYLDPALLGPLFRFNRDYYVFDEKGRPSDYKNLEQLRARVAPLVLRRRKADVETELPDRTDRTRFVALTPRQRAIYSDYQIEVARLAALAQRRPLLPKEQDRLMVHLAMMRMVCDTPAIIKGQDCADCPKLAELARILDEALADPDVKVIIFSEWEKMLSLVRDHAVAHGIGFAWHTGSVPQARRRSEIIAFRDDPACRLFLSTDSGGVGLNLQNASVVINCDLPWNPAKLEQRIARAWRKNQSRPVTVFNLVAENTLEQGMLASLAAKQDLSDGVLDGRGDLSQLKLRRGRDALMQRIGQILGASSPGGAARGASDNTPAADPAAAFAASARARLGARLLRCEETFPATPETPAPRSAGFVPLPTPAAPRSVILAVVEGSAADVRPHLESLLADTPWPAEQPRPTLQVLDQATWSALELLASTGMLTLHARASRPLLDADAARPPIPPGPPPLTPAQQARHDQLRDLARRKARAAQALFSADLVEEALPSLRAAALAHAQAAAIQARAPEPTDLAAANKEPDPARWPAEARKLLPLLSRESADASDLLPRESFTPLVRVLLGS